jgi:hypothetical protein
MTTTTTRRSAKSLRSCDSDGGGDCDREDFYTLKYNGFLSRIRCVFADFLRPHQVLRLDPTADPAG